MKFVKKIFYIWRYLGIGWLVYRLKYFIYKRYNILCYKTPTKTWKDYSWETFIVSRFVTEEKYLDYRCSNHAPRFFFSSQDFQTYKEYLKKWDQGNSPIDIANKVLAGKFIFYSHLEVEAGFPPNWNKNAITGETPPMHHWSLLSDFDYGDIKNIWELNRFGFSYALVRSYWRTSDERYSQAFWLLLEDWLEHNPPQMGVNWKCGQEIAFRIMSWCFALYGFLNSSHTTNQRVVTLARAIFVQAHRIEKNISYALSQKNNHGISEALALWTVGVLFPEFSHAKKWENTGRKFLKQQCSKLIYQDGSFSQHSVNYHRLMLHNFLWVERLAQLNQRIIFYAKQNYLFEQATKWLYHLQEDRDGQVPYYGQNDGALVLPLNNCDYLDFRAVINSCYYLQTGKKVYLKGLHEEDLLWLFGKDALKSNVSMLIRVNLPHNKGGYYTLRSKRGFVLIRSDKFKHRPSQADMFHLDLWWQGQNIACDPGTFSYNAAPPWNNPLAETFYHNTITVDDKNQMERVSKFLWLPWLKARSCHYQLKTQDKCQRVNFLRYWEGEHNGYHRLHPKTFYRRGILYLGGETWLVLDKLNCTSQRKYSLHWLFSDFLYTKEEQKLTLNTPMGNYFIYYGTFSKKEEISLIRADEKTARGWRAPYYHQRQPAISLKLESFDKNAVFWTLLSPHPCSISIEENIWEITFLEYHTKGQILPKRGENILKKFYLDGHEVNISTS